MGQSHEEMIKEFAKLAGNLNTDTTSKQNKWNTAARKVGFEVGKLAVAFAAILALSILGWVFLDTLHEVGLISWSVTFWQGIRLIAPPLLFIIATPFTLNIRLKS